MITQPIPLRPDYDIVARQERRAFSRALAAVALSATRSVSAESIVKSEWPNDSSASFYTKAAVSPSTTAISAITPTKVGDVLLGLAPQSAAIRLFSKCVQFNFDGVYQFSVPRPALLPVPIFIGEGAPMPMTDATLASVLVGPTKKILLGSAATGELADYTPENAATVIARMLADVVARNFDTYVFDAVAADSVRPAGLLHSVTPLTATAGGGINAVVADLANLGGAIAAAGGNADNVVIIASPEQAVALRLLAGPNFTSPVFSTVALAPGTIVAIDPNGIGTGYSGLPTVETSTEGVAHFEAANPLQIASGPQGSGVLATPTRSAWQTYTQLIKIRLNAAYGVLTPGAVQVVNAVTW